MTKEEIGAKLKVIKSVNYDIKPLDKGYSDKTLYVNVGSEEVMIKDVPAEMKEKFVGGKGY